MDPNKKINPDSINNLIRFYETYNPIEKSHKKHKISNPNVHKKHSNDKIDPLKKHKRRFSPNIKKTKKMYSNSKITNPSNYNHKHHQHKSSELTNNFHIKNQLYKRDHYKSQDRPIKINLVSLKFRIADDFNEENSNKFLNEKVECLKEVILSDEIKEEAGIPFFVDDLSPIGKNGYKYNLNSKRFKKKKVKDDSIALLSKLIDDIK